MKPATSAPDRVSTLELFFDLVFVFTITQVSTIIVQSPGAEGVARAAIVLGVIRATGAVHGMGLPTGARRVAGSDPTEVIPGPVTRQTSSQVPAPGARCAAR